jgi:hypothetical protein
MIHNIFGIIAHMLGYKIYDTQIENTPTEKTNPLPEETINNNLILTTADLQKMLAANKE